MIDWEKACKHVKSIKEETEKNGGKILFAESYDSKSSVYIGQSYVERPVTVYNIAEFSYGMANMHRVEVDRELDVVYSDDFICLSAYELNAINDASQKANEESMRKWRTEQEAKKVSA